MKILHLCSDYSKQKLYSELLTHLSDFDISQKMYVPVRAKHEIGKYDVSSLSNIEVEYSFILKTYHRFLFKKKIKTIYLDVIKKIDAKKYELTHAHFLFSDGAVALKLYKNFQIPYVVSVRNTDVNFFFKYYKNLKSLGNEILSNAEKIIFVTPSYRDVVGNKYVYASMKESFEDKCIILPNGLDTFWFSNEPSNLQKQRSESIKLLYVGDFTPNKNVESIINSAKKLLTEGFSVSLTLVGGGGKGSERTLKKVSATSDLRINFLGRINSREKLKQIYQEHDIFIMLSFRETFGMVYIEAMSQGVPIIYTKGQGVDGYFSEEKKPGLAVNPNDTDDIVEAITKVWNSIDEYSASALDVSEQFHWDLIVNKLFKIYKTSIHE